MGIPLSDANFVNTEVVVPELSVLIFIAIFGAALGSYLSVAIFRANSGFEGLFTPKRSSCPKCGTVLKWTNQIPVFSYIFQNGRCASCGKKISWLYPALEIYCGFAAVFSVITFGLSLQALALFVGVWACLCSVAIIYLNRIKPESERAKMPYYVTGTLIVAGLYLALRTPQLQEQIIYVPICMTIYAMLMHGKDSDCAIIGLATFTVGASINQVQIVLFVSMIMSVFAWEYMSAATESKENREKKIKYSLEVAIGVGYLISLLMLSLNF